MMIARGTVFLMYHEIGLPSRSPCQVSPGYTRYVVAENDFRRQLALLRSSGLKGESLGEGLEGLGTGRNVVITFDDGCETDLITAAPLLREVGFNATFFGIAGFVGKRGYLNKSQLRELSDQGYEIGCHSMTHAYLANLDEDRVRFEIQAAKHKLEDYIGRRIDHFSCPGGRWSRRVASAAQEAGYRSVCTSRIGTNMLASDLFCLKRIAVMNSTTDDRLLQMFSSYGQMVLHLKDRVLAAAKSLLGDSLYERSRSALLSDR